MQYNGSVRQTNEKLLELIGVNDEGLLKLAAYDSQAMEVVYMLNDSDMKYIAVSLKNRDLLPRPASVSVSLRDGSASSFGFAEDDENFYNGNFESDEI